MNDWQAREAENKKKSKIEMYKALKKHPKIAKIEVEYNGSGDSGNIDSVKFFDLDGSEVIDSPGIEELVSDYVYKYLPGGWEINEGSFGTCSIDVRAKKAHFDHSDYVQTSQANPFDDDEAVEKEEEKEEGISEKQKADLKKARDLMLKSGARNRKGDYVAAVKTAIAELDRMIGD